MHLSKQSIPSRERINEVNALTEPTPTCWRICLFMEGKEDREDFLKAVGSTGGVWCEGWEGHGVKGGRGVA